MLSNFEDWENIIHFGNFFASIGKKTYFLALGTIPVTGVGLIARKITDSGRIRTLVAIATYSSHRLTMGKVEICNFFLSQWRYLEFFFTEMFIE